MEQSLQPHVCHEDQFEPISTSFPAAVQSDRLFMSDVKVETSQNQGPDFYGQCRSAWALARESQELGGTGMA